MNGATLSLLWSLLAAVVCSNFTPTVLLVGSACALGGAGPPRARVSVCGAGDEAQRENSTTTVCVLGAELQGELGARLQSPLAPGKYSSYNLGMGQQPFLPLQEVGEHQVASLQFWFWSKCPLTHQLVPLRCAVLVSVMRCFPSSCVSW